MKRKESWRRAVIVLGITFVFGGITGEIYHKLYVQIPITIH